MQRDLERRRRCGHSRDDERGCRVGDFRILHQHGAVDLIDQVGEPRRIARGNEKEKRSDFSESARQLLPARAAKDFLANVGVGAARHHVEVWSLRRAVADLVERDAVEKTIGDTVRVLLGNQVAQRRDVADEIADNAASVFGLGLCNAECDVGSREWIRRRYNYRGVAAQKWSDLPSGVLPCDGASAGDTGIQGEPS